MKDFKDLIISYLESLMESQQKVVLHLLQSLMVNHIQWCYKVKCNQFLEICMLACGFIFIFL